MASKAAQAANKAIANAKKKKAVDKKKPASTKKNGEPRKPRMSAEDYSIIKFALEALIDAEEEKELEYHRRHTVGDIVDGVPELFNGTYADLCVLQEAGGQPTGTVIRSKAQVLLQRVAPHVNVTK